MYILCTEIYTEPAPQKTKKAKQSILISIANENNIGYVKKKKARLPSKPKTWALDISVQEIGTSIASLVGQQREFTCKYFGNNAAGLHVTAGHADPVAKRLSSHFTQGQSDSYLNAGESGSVWWATSSFPLCRMWLFRFCDFPDIPSYCRYFSHHLF